MKSCYPSAAVLAVAFFFFLIVPSLSAQNVGIGVALPLDKLHIGGEVRVNGLAGTNIRMVGADANGTLQAIGPGNNGEVMMQTATGPSYEKPVNFHSVNLTGDVQISAATYTNVTGMTVSFTATQTEALLMFSASGFAFTNSMAFVSFRIMDGTTSLGGTNTKMQSHDDVSGTVTAWSCNYHRKITGLTIGTTYTYTLQGQVGGILGTSNAAIFTNSVPDGHHATLTVMQ